MNNANNNNGQRGEDETRQPDNSNNNNCFGLDATNNGLQQQLAGLQGLQLLQNSSTQPQHYSLQNPTQQPSILQYPALLGSALLQQINEATASAQQPPSTSTSSTNNINNNNNNNSAGIPSNILSSILFGANQVAQLPITSQNNSNTNIPLLTTASLTLSAAAATAAKQLTQCHPVDGAGTGNNNNTRKPKRKIGQGPNIVPCRARSIAKDHNEKTAYFIIPSGIRHGDGLLCSHVKCKNKGVRFVYCEVCDQPVAKVNFTTRHRHPEVFGQSESTTTTTVIGSVTDNRSSYSESEKKRSATKTPKKKKRSRDSMESSSATVSGLHSSEDCPPYVSQDDSNKRKREQSVSAVTSSQRDNSSGSNFDGKSPADSSSNSMSARRNWGQNRTDQSTHQLQATATTNIQREWLALLEQRPSKKDRKSMRVWMERVLFTSEYVAPAKAPTEQDSTSGSSRGSRGSQSSSGTQSSGTITGLLADAMGSLESIHQALSKMNETPSPLHGIPTSSRPTKSSTTSTSNQNSSSSNWEEEFREAMKMQVVDEKPESSSMTMSGRQHESGSTSNENTTTSNEDPPASSSNNQNSSSNGEDDRDVG